MNSSRTVFIINPVAASGRGQARWAELKAGFLQDNAEAKVLVTTQSGEAVRLAQEAAPNCDLVVAVGGDGTVFEVVSGLLLSGATNTQFGIVPIGTGNDVARQCGIRDPAQARVALQGGRTKALDVIRIQCCSRACDIGRTGVRPSSGAATSDLRSDTGNITWSGRSRLAAPEDERTPTLRSFLASSQCERDMPVKRFALLYGAVGIVAEVLKQTTPRVKRLFGPRLAYHVGALRAILSYRPPPMQVTCDGQTQEGHFLMVCASNSEEAGGGMRLAPGALMDDGQLNLNLCKPIGRSRTVALLWNIFKGRQLSHPKLRYFPVRTVSVAADPPIEVEADGELIGHTPALFEVMPRALKVLVH